MGLYSLLNRGASQPALYTLVITGALLSIVPIFALFLFLQRYWKLDLVAGGIKAETALTPRVRAALVPHAPEASPVTPKGRVSVVPPAYDLPETRGSPGGAVKLLLTSGGVTNGSIRDALLGMLGKPIDRCRALVVPTAQWGHPMCGPASCVG